MMPTIGIIGAGHLGRALAGVFRECGTPDDHLLVSHAGSPATLGAIRLAGLSGNLAENCAICQRADIIFVAVRPQSAASLSGLCFPTGRHVVSCMAGIPAGVLSRRWGVPVTRMMPSGPDTLPGGRGVAALYPGDSSVACFLQEAGIRVFCLASEEEMHVFTAGVCLPAAILAAGGTGLAPGIEETARAYPLVADLYPWACSVLPSPASDRERDAYIAAMSTKGGITEAIVTAVRSGALFPEAFRAGIMRCREISEEAASRL